MPPQTTINLEPAVGRLIVQPEESDRSPGGLYLPVTMHKGTSFGRVVAINREVADEEGDPLYHPEPPLFGIGDWIVFGAHSGVVLTIDRTKYIVLNEHEVLARIVNTMPQEVEAH